MRMSYEELLNKGLIKRFKPSPSQVKNRIELAKRDIKAARLMMANVEIGHLAWPIMLFCKLHGH